MKKKNVPVSIPTMEQVAGERERLRYRKRYFRVLRGTLSILLVVAAAAVLAATLFLPVLQVSGSSMEPTLSDGDIIVLEKTNQYKPGDLCGLYWQNKLLLKRVIALPGSYVDIDQDGNVTIDGQALDEPYLTEKSLGECDITFPYQVPDGKLFVMGDHRATSIDSRSSAVGCIDKTQIVGRAVLRIWPFGKLKWIH
jgi:signal peptidase I